LHRDIAVAFGDVHPGDPSHSAEPQPDMRTPRPSTNEHGRVEIRGIAVFSETVSYLYRPGPTRIARLESRRIVAGREPVRISRPITGMPPRSASMNRSPSLEPTGASKSVRIARAT